MTDIPIRDYIEQIISEREALNVERYKALQAENKALRELIDARLESLALAVDKQEAQYKARFEGVNEWRETFGDVATRAVSRDMFTARREETDRRLNGLEQRLANIDGRIVGWSAGVGVVVLIISIVAQLLNFGG